MKKVAFVWNYPARPIDLLYWWDGLRAALDKLREFYEVQIYTANNIEDIDKPDAILVWGNIDSPLCAVVQGFGVPSAFLYAGGPKNHPNLINFDHVFYESECDGEEFRKLGYSTSKAFGTNTELFNIQPQPKIFDAIFPATFARWKRHDLFAKAVEGLKAIACGNWQEVEEECRTICIENGILTTKAVHPEALVSLYNASKCTVITSDSIGGSQRAVLESLACGTKVAIMPDNVKCKFGAPGLFIVDPGFVKGIIENTEVNPQELRQWVLDNYSETIYMQQLKSWLDDATQNFISST